MHHAHAKIAIVAAAAALAVGCANDTTTDTEDTTETTVTTTVETTPAEEDGAAAPESPDADPAAPPAAPGEATTITTPEGEFELGGAILEKYNEMGGETGVLGMPTSNEEDAPNDGRFVTFEGGAIYWSPATEAHAVMGGIREAWEADGGPEGPLGFPTSEERTIPGGWEADFENGTIRYVDGQAQVEER